MKRNYWKCIIGPVKTKDIPVGGDFPLRMSVKDKFEEMFGDEIDFTCSSGWGLSEKMKDRLSIISLLDEENSTLKKIDNLLKKRFKK